MRIASEKIVILRTKIWSFLFEFASIFIVSFTFRSAQRPIANERVPKMEQNASGRSVIVQREKSELERTQIPIKASP